MGSFFARRWISAATFLVALIGAAFGEALAYSNNPAGITGRTNRDGGAGCAGCHGSSSSVFALTITGPSSLTAGQTAAYTFTVTRTDAFPFPDGNVMGLAVASSDSGTPLSVFSGEPMSVVGVGEVIHSSGVGALHTTSGNSANYKVNYTMPAAASPGTTHTLYAVSHVQANIWNHAANFTVTTAVTPPGTLTASNANATTVDLSWSGGGPEYRVLYSTGTYVAANENDGTQAYQGSGTSTTVMGLTPSTQYTFTIFSKASGQNVFSSAGPHATTTTTQVTVGPRYVNASSGVNVGDCTSANAPCKTITYAMAQATQGDPGDAVNVAPGTYNVALGEAFPITMKSGVQLVSTGTADNTFIDGSFDTVKQGLLALGGNLSTSTLIRGFTFRNGLYIQTQSYLSAFGGALNVSFSSVPVTIDRNYFGANGAYGYNAGNSNGNGSDAFGGAISVYSAPFVITNNVFSGNVAQGGQAYANIGTQNGGSGYGGAIYYSAGIYPDYPSKITNNTFYGNDAIGGNGQSVLGGTANGGIGVGGALDIVNAPNIDNNIFAFNGASSGTGGTPGTSIGGAVSASSASPTKNLFYANELSGNPGDGDTGAGAIMQDPKFFLAGGDMRLLNSSPAKGAGTNVGAPAVDYLGTTRPNPPSIGAYEAYLKPSHASCNIQVPDGGFTGKVGEQETIFCDAPIPGTVTFKDGSTTLCNSVTLTDLGGGSGQAQCVTTFTAAGDHTINLQYSGNTDYAPDTESFMWTVNKADQTITFGALANKGLGDPPFTISATASSGLTVAFSSATTGICTVSGTSVTLVAVGTCTINANQSGNANYLAAPQVARSFQVMATVVNHALSVNIAGAGSGTVTSSPAGINCGVTCSANFAQGTMVTLTAYAAGGSTFAGWSGAGCSGTGTCQVTMNAAASTTATFDLANPPRLINISTRGQVQTGFNVMIGGFVVSGAGQKTVVVRAIGPSLVNYGVQGALANPKLTLVRSADQSVVAVNDDWGSAANASQIQSSGFAPSNPLESTIYMALDPGAYTAIVEGVGGGTGVGLVEVYEVDQPATPLINISTRGRVQTGFDVMIGGFVISGSGQETVVIRGIGPSLANFGVQGALGNPKLTLVRQADQTIIAANDDWGSASNASTLQASGFAPSDGLEAAIYITLDPGAYTAILEGVGGGTGVGLVEVYRVGP